MQTAAGRDLIDSFLEMLAVERGAAANTVDAIAVISPITRTL